MKVTLIGGTQNSIYSICLAIAIMKEKNPQKYVDSLTREQKESLIKELFKTRLRGALEFASFEFLVEGVSRTFTHQLVRHRTFHFSQQSMRFFNAKDSKFINPQLTLEHSHHIALNRIATASIEMYEILLKIGCPIEDARSILPQNIETKIMFGCTYRGLIDLAEVRMCHQTQKEFKEFMKKVKDELRKQNPFLADQLQVVCQRTKQCEFRSIYDRPCPIEQTLKGGKQ